MKLGVIISPAAGYSYDEIIGLALETERKGLESFWVSDHFFGGEGFPDRDCLDAWTLLAKMVAGVDQMSDGRVEFGIGAGWKDNEYKAYGYEFADPGARVTQMNEAIQICRLLWTEERATFAGKHYRIEDAVGAPKPKQRPHPPIWVGGRGPRVMRSAARYADGFDISRRSTDPGPMDAAAIRRVNVELDEICKTVKRERPLLRSHWSSVTLTDDASVAELKARISGFAQAGLDRFILAFPRESATEMIRRVPV